MHLRILIKICRCVFRKQVSNPSIFVWKSAYWRGEIRATIFLWLINRHPVRSHSIFKRVPKMLNFFNYITFTFIIYMYTQNQIHLNISVLKKVTDSTCVIYNMKLEFKQLSSSRFTLCRLSGGVHFILAYIFI